MFHKQLVFTQSINVLKLAIKTKIPALIVFRETFGSKLFPCSILLCFLLDLESNVFTAVYLMVANFESRFSAKAQYIVRSPPCAGLQLVTQCNRLSKDGYRDWYRTLIGPKLCLLSSWITGTSHRTRRESLRSIFRLHSLFALNF